jgi:hypothetical protein
MCIEGFCIAEITHKRFFMNILKKIELPTKKAKVFLKSSDKLNRVCSGHIKLNVNRADPGSSARMTWMS